MNSDFRACLAILSAFNDNDLTNREKTMVMLLILYGEENLGRMADYNEACKRAVWFLNCGRYTADEPKESHKSPLMDWEQDEQLIFSGIAATIGRDVRMDAVCYYWAFMSYFMGMGECSFTVIKTIRHKLSRHEKLEQWEQSFYRNNRGVVDIRREEEARENLFRQVFGVE